MEIFRLLSLLFIVLQGESKSQFPQEDTKELHSVKAFAEFIKQRKAYEPPPFLRRAIGWQDETDED